MFVQSLLLAGALGGEPSRVDDDRAPSPPPFTTVETMRRLLVQKIGERSDEIRGPAGAATVGGTGEPASGLGPSGVANRFLEGVYANVAAGGAAGVRADAVYVPGLAAVFAVEVPVRVVAKPQPASEKPAAAESREDDDAEWEAVAGGETSEPMRSYLRAWAGARGSVKTIARTSHAYSEESIAALRETVVDTLVRFARRLELESGERVAVVVTLTPAQARFANAGAGLYEAVSSDSAWIGVGPTGAAGAGVSDSDGDGFPDVLLAAAPPPATRYVFEIASEDLAAHAAGRIDVQRFAECVRVKRY